MKSNLKLSRKGAPNFFGKIFGEEVNTCNTGVIAFSDGSEATKWGLSKNGLACRREMHGKKSVANALDSLFRELGSRNGHKKRRHAVWPKSSDALESPKISLMLAVFGRMIIGIGIQR